MALAFTNPYLEKAKGKTEKEKAASFYLLIFAFKFLPKLLSQSV
jgi:hypothetical protein